jgi:hypothetical protein
MGVEVNVRFMPRARADAAARSAKEYVEIATVVAALRSAQKLPGERFAVVDDRWDIYVCDVPGTKLVMIIVCDPATPQDVVVARLWPDGNFTPRVKETMAREAAAALGLINPQIFVY